MIGFAVARLMRTALARPGHEGKLREVTEYMDTELVATALDAPAG